MIILFNYDNIYYKAHTKEELEKLTDEEVDEYKAKMSKAFGDKPATEKKATKKATAKKSDEHKMPWE